MDIVRLAIHNARLTISALMFLLVAGWVAVAWAEGAPLVPANGGRADGGSLGRLRSGLSIMDRLRSSPARTWTRHW